MKKKEYIAINAAYLDELRNNPAIKPLSRGVLYEDLCPTAETGNKTPDARSIVTCHYKGMLINGNVFDNSYERNCPEAFRVCDLIEGFQIALLNMHTGNHWRVYIPQELGYGKYGSGSDIPGGSTLIFEIELLTIS